MLGLCARRRLLCSAAKVDHFAALNVQARATAICPRADAHTLRPIARSHLRCAPRAAPVRSRRAPAAQNVPSDHGATRATRAARARHSVRQRTAQAQTHPDRFASAAEAEREAAAARAAEVTDAYTILSRPHKRAAHMLELNGSPLTEENEGAALLGPDFLMYIMEVREELDESPQPSRVAEILAEVATREGGVCDELAAAFGANDTKSARALTGQLQYLHRVREEIKEAHDVTL